jgi:uncharacterized membrane protein
MPPTKKNARRLLAAIWFGGALILLAFFVAEHLGGRFEGRQNEAWNWFLPTVTPITALLIASFVTEAQQGGGPRQSADSFFVRVCAGLITVYLLLLGVTIVVSAYENSPVQRMESANLYLSPLQGFVVAALGAYFTKSKPED